MGNVEIETICNDVNLSISPYNHTGVVKSGYAKIGKGNSALGFIFYGREKTDISDITNYPTIIWLNGGPGSSSQLANFMVLGPTYVQPAPMAPYQLIKNHYSWVKNYNVLFVDQPVGTGLSYADTSFQNVFCKTLDDVAHDFWNFLKELYTNTRGCFHELKISPSQDLLIFGEGYAGKYVAIIG
jgi:carboxypeptidase C (cathepsin A)